MKPLAGSPLRPKNHGCHGQRLDTQGTSFSSHWSDTGLAVSGVLPTAMMSIFSFKIRSAATSPARFGFDWLSRTTTCTGYLRPPMASPSLNSFCTSPMTNLSASPKAARGPVCGET